MKSGAEYLAQHSGWKTTKPTPKDRYLVISYNSDQQQFHYDFVSAKTADAAKEQILALREYYIDADAISARELVRMGKRSQTVSDKSIGKWIAELQKEADNG